MNECRINALVICLTNRLLLSLDCPPTQSLLFLCRSRFALMFTGSIASVFAVRTHDYYVRWSKALPIILLKLVDVRDSRNESLYLTYLHWILYVTNLNKSVSLIDTTRTTASVITFFSNNLLNDLNRRLFKDHKSSVYLCVRDGTILKKWNYVPVIG